MTSTSLTTSIRGRSRIAESRFRCADTSMSGCTLFQSARVGIPLGKTLRGLLLSPKYLYCGGFPETNALRQDWFCRLEACRKRARKKTQYESSWLTTW